MSFESDSGDRISTDVVVPFALDERDVTGRVTRLSAIVNDILGRHDYPDLVSALLSQALAMTALLGSMMKSEGIFTLQAKGDGPINLLVTDFVAAAGADGAISIGGILRGYARYDEDAVAALDAGESDLQRLMGKGYLAFTLDQGEDTERYQGIVSLEGQTLDDCARNYFENSEQIPAEIVSYCGKLSDDADGPRWSAGSIMIRHLPATGGRARTRTPEQRTEDWSHSKILLSSLRRDELLDPALPLHDLLFRLYHEDGVRVFSPAHLGLGCRCSRERLETVIRTFSPEDRAHMMVNGVISAICEFCKTEYVFNPADFEN